MSADPVMTADDAADLKAWREMFAALVSQPLAGRGIDVPKLWPRPDWPQDVAAVAYTLTRPPLADVVDAAHRADMAMAFAADHADMIATLFRADAEIQRLRELAATCYAGLVAECDLPNAWADVFLAATNGDPFTTDALLPFMASDRDAAR